MTGGKSDTPVIGDISPHTESEERKHHSPVEEELVYDERMTKRLVRNIDWHIMPVLVVLYLLSFLDRTNIGNARLANLEQDLKMSGLNYNVSMVI